MPPVGIPPQLRSNPPPRAGGERAGPSQDFADLEDRILRRLNKSCHMIPICVTVGTTPQVLRPAEPRFYFFIENTHTANDIAINFDSAPEIAYKGVIMGPHGAYEPYWVPDNEIHIVASAAGTTAFVLIATQLGAR